MTYGLDEDFTDWILRTELFLLQTILSTVRGGHRLIIITTTTDGL